MPSVWNVMEGRRNVQRFAPPQVIPPSLARFTGPCEACRRRRGNRRACGVTVSPFAAGRCKALRRLGRPPLPLEDWSDAPGEDSRTDQLTT